MSGATDQANAMTDFFGVFNVKIATALRTLGAIGERQFATI
jgi:hypothetical protein